MQESKAIDSFRRQFFEQRFAKVRAHGILVLDEASILLQNVALKKDVIVSDTFSSPRTHGSITHFLAGLDNSWWSPRQMVEEGAGGVVAQRGLYARFLPQTSYDIIFEFVPGETQPSALWRVDSRGRASVLPCPKDDGEFRDQTGTFLDLRFGWSWLAQEYSNSRSMVAAEVEDGYVIGIRPNASAGGEDPLEREDPEVAELADRYGRTRFDCVEILNQTESDQLPFASETFCKALLMRYLPNLSVDVFVLASSESFFAVIEEFADQDAVDVDSQNTADAIELVFTKGPIVQRMNLAYPFLRSIYTARTFADGVREFIYPLIRQVSSAHDLYLRLQGLFPNYRLEVDAFGIVSFYDFASNLVSRRNLFRLSMQPWTHSEDSDAHLVKLIGALDGDVAHPSQSTLDRCPICARPSRVSKNVRPMYSLGDLSQRFAGVSTSAHMIYYVQECEQHTIPLELEPGRELAELEVAYQRGLNGAATLLLDAHHDAEHNVWTFVGHDVASVVLEPGRVTALMVHFGIRLESVRAMAFYPDVLVLTDRVFSEEPLEKLREKARESIEGLFPDRLWQIDLFRTIDTTAEPVGEVRTVN